MTTLPDGTRSANGVLLVHKPDRFRLRLFLPLGITVFDYVSWGEHVKISLPLDGRDGPDSPRADFLPFSRDDLGQAFLRGPYAFPGNCEAHEGYERDVMVLCRNASGDLLRRIQIDRGNATVRSETSYASAQPRMVLHFDDYRLVEGFPLPYRIALEYPGRQLSVTISIDRYEVNPKLADDLFAPLPQGESREDRTPSGWLSSSAGTARS